MHFNNSTSNESNWAEEEAAAGQRLMCMVFIKAAAKRCKERKDGVKRRRKGTKRAYLLIFNMVRQHKAHLEMMS